MFSQTASIRVLFAGFALAVGAASPVTAQTVLQPAGPFITDPGAGFGGADASRTETGTTPGLGISAMTAPPQGPIYIADDFTVTGGPWRLSDMDWFAFQTQSAPFHTNSVFTAAYVKVYSGSPLAGAPLVAGDDTTNRLVSGRWSGVYRVSGTTLTSQTRPIMRLNIDMSWVPALPDGTYFVAVSLASNPSLPSSPFCVPITPRSGTAYCEQFFNQSWLTVPLDFPFTLRGRVVTPCIADICGIGGPPSPPDGIVTGDDFNAFISAFAGGDLLADITGIGGPPSPPDGIVTGDDFNAFIAAFAAGCP